MAPLRVFCEILTGLVCVTGAICGLVIYAVPRLVDDDRNYEHYCIPGVPWFEQQCAEAKASRSNDGFVAGALVASFIFSLACVITPFIRHRRARLRRIAEGVEEGAAGANLDPGQTGPQPPSTEGLAIGTTITACNLSTEGQICEAPHPLS
jgi:hypothetical protein